MLALLCDIHGNLPALEASSRTAAVALRARYGDAEWVGIVTGRIERAGPSPD
jgi:hypothetical protein